MFEEVSLELAIYDVLTASWSDGFSGSVEAFELILLSKGSEVAAGFFEIVTLSVGVSESDGLVE